MQKIINKLIELKLINEADIQYSNEHGFFAQIKDFHCSASNTDNCNYFSISDKQGTVRKSCSGTDSETFLKEVISQIDNWILMMELKSE